MFNMITSTLGSQTSQKIHIIVIIIIIPVKQTKSSQHFDQLH